MSWSSGHNASLVNICVADINDVNRNEGIYIMLSEHKHLYPYLFPSD